MELKGKVVFPDKIDLAPEHLDQIKKLVDLQIYNDVPKTKEIIERIKDAEIITANWVDITKEIIDSSPSLKHIIVPAVGYEWVDVKAAREKGINVINCPTHNTHAVAELTVGLIFAVSRNIPQVNSDLIKGEWKPMERTGVELKGKKVTLIGEGNIGSKTKQMLEALGMEVVTANSKTTSEELDKLIQEADYLVLNVPLNDNTRHMIDERRLSLMKPSAYLINTARGAIVDQKALTEVLKTNKIAGVGLDVFENEPLTGTPTEEMLEIVKLPNVVATPHIGFNTKETVFRLGLELIENIKACLDGKPINVVN